MTNQPSEPTTDPQIVQIDPLRPQPAGRTGRRCPGRQGPFQPETRLDTLRAQPYRLFFPLGAILGGIGVSEWLLYPLGLTAGYSGQAHALTQIQAFLSAFACGFLLTMVPRRTQTHPATWAEIGALTAALLLTTLGAQTSHWILAEGSFLVIVALLVRFALARFASRAAGRKPPTAFVFIPIGLLHGVIGAGIVLLAQLGAVEPGLVALGRTTLQEGLFLCLILGIGHMVLPLLTGHPVPLDANLVRHGGRARAGFALLGLLLLASFPLQFAVMHRVGDVAGLRVGYGLRAAIFTGLLVFSMRGYRPPAKPGLQRWLVWSSFWFVALGLILACVLPTHRVAMLHIMFVGGFGLMTFSVGNHVILAHGGFTELIGGKPWQVALFGGLFLLAMATRVSADFLPATYFIHLAAAAGVWIVALAVWIVFLLPKAVVPKREEEIALPQQP